VVGVEGGDDLAGLPVALARDSTLTGSGERLWTDSAVLSVVQWARDKKIGILGRECYGRQGPMRTNFECDWETDPAWREYESWEQFVSRAAQQAIGAIEAERSARPSTVSIGRLNTKYYLSSCTKCGYPFSRGAPDAAAASPSVRRRR